MPVAIWVGQERLVGAASVQSGSGADGPSCRSPTKSQASTLPGVQAAEATHAGCIPCTSQSMVANMSGEQQRLIIQITGI